MESFDMSQDFFRKVNFDALPETCRGNGEDVVTQSVLSGCRGPAFVIEGDFDTISTEHVFSEIGQKAGRERERLNRMGPKLVDFIHRFPQEAQNIQMERSSLLYSLIAYWYSLDKDKIEELERTPFHADDLISNTVIDLEGCCWHKWTNRSILTFSYCPFPEYRAENLHDRSRRFALEDLFELINGKGVVSLHRSLSDNVIEDRQEAIWSQSRNSGVREGYLENFNYFDHTGVFISEDYPGYGKGYTEVLRKELHLVIPLAGLFFEMKRTPTTVKAEKVGLYLLKLNDSQILVQLSNDPQYCKGPYDPQKESVTEKKVKDEKKSFWQSLFKK